MISLKDTKRKPLYFKWEKISLSKTLDTLIKSFSAIRETNLPTYLSTFITLVLSISLTLVLPAVPRQRPLVGEGVTTLLADHKRNCISVTVTAAAVV